MNDSSLLAYDMLRRWYIENATHHFAEKTTFWAGRIAVQPAKISIRDQKTRWGSCSSRGNINFNWRIVMAPPEIMDYLVIHELCHMRIPNHSSLYWQLVEQFMPEYRQRRDWLKHNSRLLTRIL
jgi:predicted metal-dependent hydrolase